MSEIPIPESLNPSPYSWPKDIMATMAAEFRNDPELKKTIESIVLSPDRNRRFAAALRNNTNIKYLVFDTGYTSQSMLDDISTMTSLKRLAFGYLRAPDISGLAHLKRLEYLDIVSLSSASTLRPIGQLSSLISLFIGISRKISSLEDLTDNSLNSLRALCLGESSERVITVDSLTPLGSVPTLEYVMLGRIRSRDNSLAGLLNLPELKAFQFDRNAKFCSDDIISLESKGVIVSKF